MNGQALCKLQLKDGRQAEVGYLVPSDAAAVLVYAEAIAAETDFLTFGPGEFGMSLEQQIEFIESLADRSKGFMLKATVGGALAGIAVATRATRPRVRHVATLGLSVLKAFWGGGIGRALCQTLFLEAKQVGVDRIALTVRADNEKAIRLYENLGFAHEGRLVDACRVAGVSYDELAMGLRI